MCHSAVDTGEKEDIRVYEFLKEPLIRAFGEETYKIFTLQLRKSETIRPFRSLEK